MARASGGRRRLVLLCVLIALVPLVAQRHAGRLPCGAGGAVVAAAVLLAAVPRTVLRLAAALTEPSVPAVPSCP
ncbi:hypothetical protein GCM10010492_65140 [Saccharothrix mutabilis subsp. mutabilis]|uniref:Uncharacterized protein n=1 Tax=Saccharothrix mutabilis subsp. mutabilis TaxID=66855 RepID=A0ABN0UMA3_9PSEU